MGKQFSRYPKPYGVRGGFYLLPFVVVCAMQFAFGQQSDVRSQKHNPTGFHCPNCPSPGGWRAGPDMPSTGVRMVGVYFPGNGRFYALGGRSMDGLGNDFAHPFEYDPTANSWTIKSATYPDNEVSNMACGVLNDNGADYIYCVGGSAGGQTTATDRMFRYDPVTDTIETVASPWPGDADGITLPGGFAVFLNKLYILGGFQINTGMIDTIWEFAPVANTWVQKDAHLPVALGYIPATGIFNGIYTAGGSTWDGTTLHDSNNSFFYDPLADSISMIANIPRATGETRALPFILTGGNDYDMWVMGGGREAPNPSNEIDIYDRQFNSWTTGSFQTPRRNFAVDAGRLCYIWLAGGYASDGVTPLSSMEIFCFPPGPTATATATATATETPSASPTPSDTNPPSPTPSATSTATGTQPPNPRPTPVPRVRPTAAPRPTR
jgi:cell division septation protein DedD